MFTEPPYAYEVEVRRIGEIKKFPIGEIVRFIQYLIQSIKRMSGGTKRQIDQALGAHRGQHVLPCAALPYHALP